MTALAWFAKSVGMTDEARQRHANPCIGLTRDHTRRVARQVAPPMPHVIPERPVALYDLEPFELAA